jgi:hypothetical protein
VDPHALPALSNHPGRTVGLRIEEHPRARAGELRRIGADLIWLTGHRFVEPTGPERVEIKSYLVNGGMLFASACCGRRDFDEVFQPWARALFGAERWEQVPPDDPLMTGSFAPGVASSLHALSYKRGPDGAAPARLDWPVLWGIRHNNRWITPKPSPPTSCSTRRDIVTRKTRTTSKSEPGCPEARSVPRQRGIAAPCRRATRAASGSNRWLGHGCSTGGGIVSKARPERTRAIWRTGVRTRRL